MESIRQATTIWAHLLNTAPQTSTAIWQTEGERERARKRGERGERREVVRREREKGTDSQSDRTESPHHFCRRFVGPNGFFPNSKQSRCRHLADSGRTNGINNNSSKQNRTELQRNLLKATAVAVHLRRHPSPPPSLITTTILCLICHLDDHLFYWSTVFANLLIQISTIVECVRL